MKFKKSLGAAGVLIIIAAILFVGIGGFFVYRMYGPGQNDSGNNQNGVVGRLMNPADSSFDQQLVGTWESDCLVPAPENSKWAEKHKFIISKDGTATHTRQSWGMIDCTTLQPENTITSQFKLTIPSSGKINLTYTAYDNPEYDPSMLESIPGMTAPPANANFVGSTIYDIYGVSALTLKFGHGFRNHESYGSKSGGSEADRFDTLNNYIVYRKK